MTGYESLMALLGARHSCRAFTAQPVARETIGQILRAAQRVPSWCNAQPWQVVVTGPDETARLAEALTQEALRGRPAPDLPFPSGYSGCHRARRRECGWQLYDAVGVEKGDRAGTAREMMKNYRFFGAPHVALVTSAAELGSYGALDTGGFITAFTLAAQALGVASIPQAAPAAFAPFLREWFGLGEDRLVLATLAFGHEDEAHPANTFRTTRAGLEEWVRWRD